MLHLCRFVKLLKGIQVASLSMAIVAMSCQSVAQVHSEAFTIRGTVRDSKGRPIAGATVTVEPSQPDPASTILTDQNGAYILSLPPAKYSVKATKTGYFDAKVGPISLETEAAKNVDLTLPPVQSSTAFYDQPQFTVSGVTDTTSLGGHGSDTVVRTRDALAKETAGLTKNSGVVSSPVSAEPELRETVERAPDNVDANRRLAEFLLQNGRGSEALPYLERAAKLKPNDDAIEFDLALANAQAGNYERAKQEAHGLLWSHETAEIHHLLGDIAEKVDDPLEAVRQYQSAAEMSPRESYLFDWGAELLLHHAPEPALEVFSRGNQLFPQSLRMLIGMGASEFAQGHYDHAVERVGQASDLAPNDPVPYIFLGKMDRIASISSEVLVERLQRFAQASPENPQADYYYAAALWKRRKVPGDKRLMEQVESLLKTAIRIDPKFSAAHLQLGILYSEQRDFEPAIHEYQQAIQFDPQEAEAHFRLAQAYRQVGKPEKSKVETDIYDRISRESAAKADRERHEVRQFVYTLRDPSTSEPQH